MADNIDKDKLDPISNLDTKLDSFLSDDFTFEEKIDDKLKQIQLDKELQGIKQVVNQQQKLLPQNTLDIQTEEIDKDKITEDKIRKHQIEKDLQAIKSAVKPKQNMQNIASAIVSPEQLEQKFSDKEIDNALKSLKDQKLGADKHNIPSISNDAEMSPVTDEDIDQSLIDVLKKIN